MRTGTSPLFPASTEGAVTLNAVIETREGDRLPLELALYVSLEVSKQVARLHALIDECTALLAADPDEEPDHE